MEKGRTAKGNYYLPPGVCQREREVGLMESQSMTIAPLRAKGIECVPMDRERPESVYGYRE